MLSVDINSQGTRIVSCGMDNAIKVWRLGTPELEAKIADSYVYEGTHDNERRFRFGNAASDEKFPTAKVFSPFFSSYEIHKNYVDCAKWFGDLVFSKV